MDPMKLLSLAFVLFASTAFAQGVFPRKALNYGDQNTANVVDPLIPLGRTSPPVKPIVASEALKVMTEHSSAPPPGLQIRGPHGWGEQPLQTTDPRGWREHRSPPSPARSQPHQVNNNFQRQYSSELFPTSDGLLHPPPPAKSANFGYGRSSDGLLHPPPPPAKSASFDNPNEKMFNSEYYDAEANVKPKKRNPERIPPLVAQPPAAAPAAQLPPPAALFNYDEELNKRSSQFINEDYNEPTANTKHDPKTPTPPAAAPAPPPAAAPEANTPELNKRSSQFINDDYDQPTANTRHEPKTHRRKRTPPPPADKVFDYNPEPEVTTKNTPNELNERSSQFINDDYDQPTANTRHEPKTKTHRRRRTPPPPPANKVFDYNPEPEVTSKNTPNELNERNSQLFNYEPEPEAYRKFTSSEVFGHNQGFAP